LNYDVLVAGGGTAGLFAAYRLAKAGLSVAMVERKTQENIGEKVCGDAVGEHHFKEVGLEPPRIGVDAVHEFRGVRVYSPSKRAHVTAYGKGYALDRKAFGQRLLRLALDAGAELLDSHVILKPIVEESWVKGLVVRGGGGTKELRSKVVVEATGSAAAVRTKLPKEWWVSEDIPKEDYNIAYRVIAEVEERQDPYYALIYLDVEVAPGGYWWWFPKGEYTVNVGLGVRPDLGVNPKKQVEKVLYPILEKAGAKIIHEGGGLVPTRRPLPCMVWNGLVAVGDAACTANPIHGGGIGPSLDSSYHATNTIIKALEEGEPTIEALWPYHRAYIETYGDKQAGLDALRIFLQGLTNDDLDFAIEKGIVTDKELSEMGYQGELLKSIVDKAVRGLKLITRPTLLRQIVAARDYVNKAKKLYAEFPEMPDKFEEWRTKQEKLFAEIKARFWRSTP